MNIEHLKGYIKRKLGYPVINIEIDDTQLKDSIDDAFEMFSEFHVSGTDIGYIFLDIIADQSIYVLDDSVYDVLGILSTNYNLSCDDENLLLSPFYLGNATGFSSGSSLIDIEIFRQNFANLRNYLGKEIVYEFNPVTKNLFLHEIPENSLKIAIKIYKGHIDPSTIYKDAWFKKYCVALVGIQWATNISKYEGGKMPGGVSFNASQIEERYQRLKESLEEELYDRFTEPPDPMVG